MEIKERSLAIGAVTLNYAETNTPGTPLVMLETAQGSAQALEALVYVPAADAAKVTESGKPAAKSPGVKFLRMEAGAAVYEIGAGQYSFVSTN